VDGGCTAIAASHSSKALEAQLANVAGTLEIEVVAPPGRPGWGSGDTALIEAAAGCTQAWHLGTNYVRIRGRGYLALMHGLHRTPLRRYLNLPYLIAPTAPYQVVAVGRAGLELSLGSVPKGFVFTSALHLLSENQLLIAYNVNDRACMLAPWALQDLLAALVEV
jgi:hypothetical protein